MPHPLVCELLKTVKNIKRMKPIVAVIAIVALAVPCVSHAQASKLSEHDNRLMY